MKNNYNRKLYFLYLTIVVVGLLISNSLRVVEVSGISMNTTLLEGDEVLIRKFKFKDSKKFSDEIFVYLPYKDDNQIVVKRCIAVPGDTIQFFQNKIVVNNKIYNDKYYATFDINAPSNKYFNNGIIQDSIKSSLKIPKFNEQNHLLKMQGNFQPDSIFLHAPFLPLWSFGINTSGKTIIIPSKNSIMPITSANKLYKNLYRKYEGQCLKDNMRENLYFSKSYFFFLGDNTNNSIDSRHYGPIPEENIIGKASLILFNNKNGKFDWSRFLKRIE